jgi:LCP family protein required for cell wall assembly
MNYNPKTSDINIVSIPRDTLIEINNKNRKINEAHAIGGVGYLIDAAEKLLDVKINYYSKLDYQGFRKIIDTIGPIEMKINRKMDYDDAAQNLHIHFNKGETVKLDGEKAEEFFRWRKNNDGTGLVLGDLDRIENQHLFVQKVIDKFKSPIIVAKMPAVLSTISKYVETNMRPEDIVKYGYLFAKTDKNNISMSTLRGDTEYIQGISYVVYDEKQNTDILNKLHAKSSIK